MRTCWGILVLSLISVSASAAIVPVNVRQPRSGLRARDAPQLAELLRPVHEIELLYADEAAIDSPMLITVTAKHDSRPYVPLERFEDMLSSITCSTGPPGNSSTVLSMTFTDKKLLALAEREWSKKDELSFVTHHDTCNHDHKQREVYRSYSIRFDYNATMAIVACDRKEFGYTTEANTAIRVRGGTAPRHLARRLTPRTLGKAKHPVEKRFIPRSFGISLDGTWAPNELLLKIPGQLDIVCRNCFTRGKIHMGIDFDLPSTDPANLIPTVAALAQGQKVEPVFDTARMTLEVVEPIEIRTNVNVIANSGVSFRWPGFIKKSSEKVVAGDKIFKDREKDIFSIGGLTFALWGGLGFLGLGWIGGVLDMTHESRLTIPAGQSAAVDFMNNSGHSFDIKPTRDVLTRVNKAEAAIATELALGAAGDLTVMVKVPNMDWNALRNGRGRGPIGYKDGKLSWYGGLFLDLPGVGANINSPAKLDENCRPSERSWAFKLATNFLVGIAPYASWAVYLPGLVIPRVDAFPIRPGPPWYYAYPLWQQCFVVGNIKGPSFSINDAVRFSPGPPTLPFEDYGIHEQPPGPGSHEQSQQPPAQQKVTRPPPPTRHPAPGNERSSSSKDDDHLIPSWSTHLSIDDR